MKTKTKDKLVALLMTVPVIILVGIGVGVFFDTVFISGERTLQKCAELLELPYSWLGNDDSGLFYERVSIGYINCCTSEVVLVDQAYVVNKTCIGYRE